MSINGVLDVALTPGSGCGPAVPAAGGAVSVSSGRSVDASGSLRALTDSAAPAIIARAYTSGGKSGTAVTRSNGLSSSVALTAGDVSSSQIPPWPGEGRVFGTLLDGGSAMMFRSFLRSA